VFLVTVGDDMTTFEEIWKLKPDYSKFGVSRNPFSIDPLFQDYKDKEKCENDEKLFVATKEAKDAVICLGLGKRNVCWGEIGVGKTTLLNMLLYLARFRDNCLPIRVIIKEDNVDRAIQELLYTYCFDLISELKEKRVTEPMKSARKWLLEKRYADKLYDFMCKLIGAYEEEKVKETKISAAAGVSVGLEAGLETEAVTVSSFKTYVENLPVKMIEERLREIQELVQKLGYKGTVFALDEADHIPDVSKVLSMLTVSRELFFASKNFTFIVAGSPEMIEQDRKREITGIFDAHIYLRKLKADDLKVALSRRIQAEKETLSLTDVFETEAIELIIKNSGGILKLAMKLAENSLDQAAVSPERKVQPLHVNAAIARVRTDIQFDLSETELRVLKALHKLGKASPSDKAFQKEAELSRPKLNTVVRELNRKKIVGFSRKGRKIFYTLNSVYLPIISEIIEARSA